MKSSSNITDYFSWKKDLIDQLDKNDSGRHGSQNNFYANLLIELFEKEYADSLTTIQVDEKFREIFNQQAHEFRVAYGFEWDNARKEGLQSKPYLDFIAALKKNEYLSKAEIKKTAQLIEQDARTSDTGFFSKIKRIPDFLAELGSYLDPNLNPIDASKKFQIEMQKARAFHISMQPFSFEVNKIAFSQNIGTHVNIIPSAIFENWFNELPSKQKISLMKQYEAFKFLGEKNDPKISINKGQGTAGIQIINDGSSFLACNNIIADKSKVQSDRNEQLKTVLSDLNNILKALTTEQIKEHSKTINLLVLEYEKRILEEKKSYWPNTDKIKLWKGKVEVLKTANLLLLDQVKPESLAEQESLYPDWKEGKEAKNCVDNVKKIKGLLENWEKYASKSKGLNKS